VDGRSGTGEIVNLVGFHVQGKTYIMADHFEIRVPEKMSDVSPSSRIEVINTDNFVTLFQKPIAEMGPQKAGSPGDENSFL
jgi:hypothetical protein